VYNYTVEQREWVYGGGLGLVDLAVNTSQEELCQTGGGHVAVTVRFSINHIPNRVFLLEVVVECLKEKPCLTVRTNLDELDAKLGKGRTRLI
jgi:hypothetical protein